MSSGGNSSPVLTNSAFQGNNATVGGVMYNYGYFGNSSPILTNCSFQGNSAGSGGGGVLYNYGESGMSSPSLTNCVVWGNGGANTFVNSIASITTRYSLFESSVTSYTTGTGNLTAIASPFASTMATLLSATALAINAGDPATTTATVGTIDLAGSPRFTGGRIDMGAYEFQLPPEVFSLKNGSWTDNSLWSAGRLPLAGEWVRLKHSVTIPANYTALGSRLLYDPLGRLIYTPGGRLRLGQ